MIRYYKLIAMIVLLVAIAACQHTPDPPIPESPLQNTCAWDELKTSILLPIEDSCREGPWPEAPPIGYQFEMPDTTWYLLGANPDRIEQFMYVQRINNAFPLKHEIWIRDLCAGTKTLVIDGVLPIGDARWHKGGWILFGADYQIWKVKADGDSLIQLTTGEGSLDAGWSADGEQIYFQHNFNSSDRAYAVMDKDGQFIAEFDSLRPYAYALWSPYAPRGITRGDTNLIVNLNPQFTDPISIRLVQP